jgi:hypothetical protein
VSNPPRTPAECFAALLTWLTRAVAARMGGEQLALSLIALIVERLRRIKQRFAYLAARVCDGLYTQRRRSARPPRRPGQPPPPPDRLPQKFGWLLPLVPEAAGYRSQLEHLLRDPEMAALLAAAPAPLRRPLRSLCRMLGVTPPPILALPAPPPAPPAAPAAKPQAPPLPSPSRPPRTAPAPAPPARACGPPFPA